MLLKTLVVLMFGPGPTPPDPEDRPPRPRERPAAEKAPLDRTSSWTFRSPPASSSPPWRSSPASAGSMAASCRSIFVCLWPLPGFLGTATSSRLLRARSSFASLGRSAPRFRRATSALKRSMPPRPASSSAGPGGGGPEPIGAGPRPNDGPGLESIGDVTSLPIARRARSRSVTSPRSRWSASSASLRSLARFASPVAAVMSSNIEFTADRTAGILSRTLAIPATIRAVAATAAAAAIPHGPASAATATPRTATAVPVPPIFSTSQPSAPPTAIAASAKPRAASAAVATAFAPHSWPSGEVRKLTTWSTYGSSLSPSSTARTPMLAFSFSTRAALVLLTRSYSPSTELNRADRSEEHTSELQSQSNLVCRLLLEKKKLSDKRIRSPRQDHQRPPYHVVRSAHWWHRARLTGQSHHASSCRLFPLLPELIQSHESNV